jgi:hypothetical protein
VIALFPTRTSPMLMDVTRYSELRSAALNLRLAQYLHPEKDVPPALCVPPLHRQVLECGRFLR